jgi:4-amino-4-deoxy-L-arabinose transferase-like glycosyltransferase
MKKALISIFIAGLLLRLAAVVIAVNDDRYSPYNRVKGDTASYVALAISMIKAEGYSDHYERVVDDFFKNADNIKSVPPRNPTYKKPPGYPVFLAVIFYIFGLHLEPILYIQALLSALSVLIVYMIGKEISSRNTALIASALAAFYYPFCYRATTIMVETLLVFLTLLFFYYFILWYKKMSYSNGFLTGFFGVLAFLVRPIVLPVLLLFLILAYLNRKRHDDRRFYTGVVLIVLGITLVLAPFAARNYRLTKHFLVTPTFGGYQFLLLYNPHNLNFAIYATDPGFMTEGYPGFEKYIKQDLKVDLPASASPVLREYEQDKIYGKTAFRFIASNPGHFFKMLPMTFWNMWRFDYPVSRLSGKTDNLCSLPGKLAYLFFWLNNFICYVCMIPFVLFGMYITVKKRYELPVFVTLFFCYFIFFHILIATNMRHRLTTMPFFFILAGLGINELFIRTRRY